LARIRARGQSGAQSRRIAGPPDLKATFPAVFAVNCKPENFLY
jgi:hypothetical protein